LIGETTYTFRNLEELYQTAENLPDAERHDVFAFNEEMPDGEQWSQMPWRNSLWLDDGRAVGDVSSSDTFYNVIQYGEILDGLGHTVEQYDGQLGVSGSAAISPSGHKFSAQLDFDGDTDVLIEDGDEISLGLKARSGHSGFHGVKYDVGAEREVCSNGMMAFVSDLAFSQTHNQPFDYTLAKHAVDSIVDGADAVENQLKKAKERDFYNEDEALLVMYDLGMDAFFDNPYETLSQSLDEETEGDVPTLYDTYNACTRALTHYVDEDMPQYEVDTGLEMAARLVDADGYGVPQTEYLGAQAVDARLDAYMKGESDGNAVQYEGEEDAVSQLLENRNYKEDYRR
jgi:hypothetical protein